MIISDLCVVLIKLMRLALGCGSSTSTAASLGTGWHAGQAAVSGGAQHVANQPFDEEKSQLLLLPSQPTQTSRPERPYHLRPHAHIDMPSRMGSHTWPAAVVAPSVLDVMILRRMEPMSERMLSLGVRNDCVLRFSADSSSLIDSCMISHKYENLRCANDKLWCGRRAISLFVRV